VQVNCDGTGGSGVATCSGPATLDTSSVGPKAFTVLTTDVAGNTREVQVAYRVVYTYGKVLQPIEDDGSSVFKAGSTVPVKFGLWDWSGASVGTATATISYRSFDPGTVAGDPQSESGTTASPSGGSQLRWDSKAQQYVFNLSTKQMKPGTYQLLVTLDDGKRYSAVINLK